MSERDTKQSSSPLPGGGAGTSEDRGPANAGRGRRLSLSVPRSAGTARAAPGWPARLVLALLALTAAPAQALEPVDPSANAEARALLDYLDGLPQGEENRVISGQTIHGDLPEQFETYVEGFQNITGSQPGIVQLMLHADWLTDRDHPIAHRSNGAVFPLSYNHANRGGHVMWLYRPNNPFNGRGTSTLIPNDRAFSEVYTPGTDAYGIWQEDLQMLALQAQRLELAGVPVTVCMFGGYNTTAKRWHNVRSNPGTTWNDFKAAWRLGVQSVRDAGAHGVLWCLEDANTAETYRRRGWQKNWVDIQSIQASHDNDTTGPLALYNDHVAKSDKPIIYGQFLIKPPLRENPPSYQYRRAVDLVRDSMPRIAAIVPWSVHEWGDPSDYREHSPVFHLQTKGYANDAWIANRGELDARFGQGKRAPLPTARDAIPMSGNHTENFDGPDPEWIPGGKGTLTAVDGGDGILDAFFFGDDPLLYRGSRKMNADFDRLRVRLRNNSLAERIELSWRRTTDSGWSDERRVSIPVDPMGLYLQEYALDLSDHPQWNGTIRQLRLHLNPDHRWGSAEVDFIRFDNGGGQAPTTLTNYGFERSLGFGWRLRDVKEPGAALARFDRKKRNGERSLLLFLRDNQNDGVDQDVTGVLSANGPGTYRYGAHFRLPDTVGKNREATVRALLIVQADGRSTTYKASATATRNGWTRVEGLEEIAWTGELERATLILRSVGTNEDLLLDDAFLDFMNGPPALEPIGDQMVEVRQTLTINVSASDSDGPAPLVLSATPLPGDATFTDQGDGSGVFEWTPTDGDAASEPYSVTFMTADDGGAGLTDSETIAIAVMAFPYPGELAVDLADPGTGTRNLTPVGTTDWKHFGRDTAGGVNRKAGVPDVIGTYTNIGSPTVGRYAGNADTRPSIAWNDGTPTASETGTPAGLYFVGEGAGFSLSLPADERTRTARIYLGGFNARGRLEATLSDASGPAFSTTIEAEGVYDRLVTIRYTAAASDQTLDVRYVLEETFGDGNLTLSAVALAAPVSLPYGDDFSDGDTAWRLPQDDTNTAVNWTISGGAMRQTVRVGYGASFEESYHRGTYRALVDGEGLTDYRAAVTITPEYETVIDDIGFMFRYQDPENYYRLSQSARQGYTRLEKRENGVFSTLGVNSIGYAVGQTTTYEILAVGSDLLVSIDGERVFAVSDTTHASGSIALYTQDAVRFDNVAVVKPGTAPTIALRRPQNQAVIPGSQLIVEATALNAPAGSQVVIDVEGYAPRTFSAPPYVVNLGGVPPGEYGITARLLNAPGGNSLATHTVGEIAVGGAYVLAVGDSNTNGLGDSYRTDNELVSRILGAQGYGGTLAAALDGMAPLFNVVYNEGISGDTAEATRYARLGSLLERHAPAIRALVALGTNDISGRRDSGEDCGAGDEACLDDTIRGDLQAIVNELGDAGLEVWTATVPPSWPRLDGSPPSPTTSRMLLTREVNRAIRNGISGDRDGPDLFEFFFTDSNNNDVPDVARRSLYSDRFHFNGLGHQIVAQLWYNALVGDATGTAISPFYLSEPTVAGYQQNLIEVGDELKIDDFETVESFPAFLEDAIWIMTAQADAGTGGSDFLSFRATRPTTLYVAYDASASGLPGWLNPATSSFEAVPGDPVIRTSEGSYRLFRRNYAAGTAPVLGGNRAGNGNAGLMYHPIVVDRSGN